ncbi:MAG TPA: alpha/beta hydrolase [Gemmataceae bacterium]|jgi:acetyl esterase/lipase
MAPPSCFRLALVLGGVLLTTLAAWSRRSSAERTNLVYARADGVPLTLDLDYPPSSRPSPHPVVLFAPPDGEWPRALKYEPRSRLLLDELTRHGYAVATIHYRLPGKHRFPAPVEDGKAAVRWLRANAGRYHLDARRIGAVGVSSGGYGVCMLGTTGPADGLEGSGGNREESSRVQAVVAMGAPAEFADRIWSHRLESLNLRPFLGGSFADHPQRYERASPGAYASADDPPFLLFHSRDDLTVPVEMARALADRLRRAGVPVTLVEDNGIEHVWSGVKLERAIKQTLHFLDHYLRPRERTPSASR